MIWSFRRRPDPNTQLLQQLLYQGKIIMADLTSLTAAVEANTTATNAVVAEVATLKSSAEQAAIDALTTTITTNNTALQGLITAPSTGTA